MNTKKLSLKIFILPYICTSIFIFAFFKTANAEYLTFSLAAIAFTSLCLFLSFMVTVRCKKTNNKANLFFNSMKIAKLLSLVSALTCCIFFLLNLFIKAAGKYEIFIFLTALTYSIFPHTLFLLLSLSFFNLSSALKKHKINFLNPNAAEDIHNSGILIIDDFDKFSNISAIAKLAAAKKIILVSALSEQEIRTSFGKVLSNLNFCNIRNDDLPNFNLNIVNIYSNTNINDVLKLIKLLNKPFIVVSDADTDTLCCKISKKQTGDITIFENDISNLQIITDETFRFFKNNNKCITYLITLSFAKVICAFVCIFICSKIPFTPQMLLVANIICDILPALSLIYDKTENSVSPSRLQDAFPYILLDSLLLGIVSFIVYMLGSLIFSDTCASAICINTYIISSLLYAFNLRAEKNIFLIGILTNKFTTLAFLTGVSATVITTCFIFTDASSFGAGGWLLITAMALIPFIVNQLQKATISIFHK